jgi:hypothetical protein
VAATAHLRLDALTPLGGAVVAVLGIVSAGGLYARVCECPGSGKQALIIGAAWLLLTIVAEVGVSLRLGHHWYALLGSPEHPFLRNVTMFFWLFAPAMFVREGVRS